MYTDLWKAGAIDDPYFGRNSMKAQWVMLENHAAEPKSVLVPVALQRTGSLEEFVNATQDAQGTIFQLSVEQFRRAKPRTSGIALCHFMTYWQGKTQTPRVTGFGASRQGEGP